MVETLQPDLLHNIRYVLFTLSYYSAFLVPNTIGKYCCTLQVACLLGKGSVRVGGGRLSALRFVYCANVGILVITVTYGIDTQGAQHFWAGMVAVSVCVSVRACVRACVRVCVCVCVCV